MGCSNKAKVNVAGSLGIIQSLLGISLSLCIIVKLLSTDKNNDWRFFEHVIKNHRSGTEALIYTALAYNAIWLCASIALLAGNVIKVPVTIKIWMIITILAIVLDIILTGIFFSTTIETAVDGKLPVLEPTTTEPPDSNITTIDSGLTTTPEPDTSTYPTDVTKNPLLYVPHSTGLYTWYIILAISLCRLGPITIITNIVLCFMVHGRVSEILKLNRNKLAPSHHGNGIELQSKPSNGVGPKPKKEFQRYVPDEDVTPTQPQATQQQQPIRNPLFVEEGQPPDLPKRPQREQGVNQQDEPRRRKNQDQNGFHQGPPEERRANQEPFGDRRSNQRPEEPPRKHRPKQPQEPPRGPRPNQPPQELLYRVPEEQQRYRDETGRNQQYGLTPLPKAHLRPRTDDPQDDYRDRNPDVQVLQPNNYDYRDRNPVAPAHQPNNYDNRDRNPVAPAHQPNNYDYRDRIAPVQELPDQYHEYARATEPPKHLKNSHLFVPTPFVTPPVDYDTDEGNMPRGYDNQGLDLSHDEPRLRRTGSGYSNNGRPIRRTPSKSNRLDDIRQHGLRKTASAASDFKNRPQKRYQNGQLHAPRHNGSNPTSPGVSRNNSLRSQLVRQGYVPDQRPPQEYSASRNSSMRSNQSRPARQPLNTKKISPESFRGENEDTRRGRRIPNPRIEEDSSEEELGSYNKPQAEDRFYF